MGYLIALLLLGILVVSLFKSDDIDMDAIPGTIISKKFSSEEICWVIIVEVDIFEKQHFTYYPDRAEVNQFKEGQSVSCIFNGKNKLKYIF